MQAGGTQVDLFFMISGFLLCYRLITAPSMPTIGRFVGRRLVRLLPGMALTTAMGLALGDNWDDGYNFGQVTRKF